MSARISAAEALQPGDVVGGRYIVRGLLGVGGMGAVYEAEHTQLRKMVALKVLLPQLTFDPDATARFFREARPAAAVGHPGIVQVFDLGTDESGLAYLAMEKLEGEELHSRIQRAKPIPAGFAVRVGIELCDAVSAAHEAGVLHRDLKPANVFLSKVGRARDVVKVLDFGIAKLQRETAAEDQVTRSGQIMGTPLYMAPEQLRGIKDVDERIDVYAIGAILYETLAGRARFRASSYAEVVVNVLREEPEDLALLRPDLPSAMIDLVKRAMSKDRDTRYRSAREVGDALVALGIDSGTPWPPRTPYPPSSSGPPPRMARPPGADSAPTLPAPTPTLPPIAVAHAVTAPADVTAPTETAPTDLTPPKPRVATLAYVLLGVACVLAVAAFIVDQQLDHVPTRWSQDQRGARRDRGAERRERVEACARGHRQPSPRLRVGAGVERERRHARRERRHRVAVEAAGEPRAQLRARLGAGGQREPGQGGPRHARLDAAPQSAPRRARDGAPHEACEAAVGEDRLVVARARAVEIGTRVERHTPCDLRVPAQLDEAARLAQRGVGIADDRARSASRDVLSARAVRCLEREVVEARAREHAAAEHAVRIARERDAVAARRLRARRSAPARRGAAAHRLRRTPRRCPTGQAARCWCAGRAWRR